MMEEPLALTSNQDTDSSLNKSQGPRQENIVPLHMSKKRIGPYSYKLSDVIGCGFSSVVYKGIKDNDKSQVVAIKVVQLSSMHSHRRQLLQKEIKILKTVNHPNVLAFRDLYWTVNNCYIITEYCQGGNLQHLLENQPQLDWRQAAYEVSIACQYLATLNIVHRDIKPANVLLKNGTFKVSDFGFSLICDSVQPISEKYLIGSPLYMPPQSLQAHLYSSKSDSFALGVLLYYMTAKRYPWKGKNKYDLLASYHKKRHNKSAIAHLPPRVQHLLHNLLQLDPSKRPYLQECDFSVFLHLGPQKNILKQLGNLKGCYQEQLVLCQFINTLKNNAIYFQWANRHLPEFMVRHLGSLVEIFEWSSQTSLKSMVFLFNLPHQAYKFESDDYYWLNNCLKDTIRELSFETDTLPLVMLEKLIRYQQVVQAILFEPYEEILLRINQIQLNTNLLMATPDHSYIGKILPNIDFYQL